MNSIERTVTELFCSNFKDKINKNENYDEYISSFTKDKIERLLKINAIIEDNNSKLAHVLAISTHKKNIVVAEFKKNIKEIYTNIIKNVNENVIKQLEIYLKEYKNNIMEINLPNIKYSLHFIELLNINCIAKVKYQKKENIIYLYTPTEIKELLKDILKNDKIKKENRKNNIYKSNLHNLISTYGIISIKKLTDIYNNIYGKIDESTIVQNIIANAMFDENIKLAMTEEGYIAYGLDFENEDDALEFFYSLPENIEYKMYTQKEYEEIGEGTYHYDFKEFDELYDFLEMNFNMSEEEIYDFDDMFVLDYIFSYQLDANIAKKNLSNNLDKLFMGLNISDKAYISKLILSIAENYPNFNYKGHTYNEIKNKYK